MQSKNEKKHRKCSEIYCVNNQQDIIENEGEIFPGFARVNSIHLLVFQGLSVIAFTLDD